MPEDQWYREFENGRRDIHADGRTGQHSTRKTDVKAAQVEN